MKNIVIALFVATTIVSCSNAADSTVQAGADSAVPGIPVTEDTTRRVQGPVVLKREQADTGHIVSLQEAINNAKKDTSVK